MDHIHGTNAGPRDFAAEQRARNAEMMAARRGTPKTEKPTIAANDGRLRIDTERAQDPTPAAAEVKSNDVLPLEVSVFKATDQLGSLDRLTPTWLDWRSILSAPREYPSKKACPLFTLSRFGDRRSPKGSLRHDANVEQIFGVIGDYDAEAVSIDDAAARLRANGVEAFLYTSASHTAAAPRWRVVAPLSKPCGPDEHARYTALLNGALGGILASESWNLSQSYYFGSVKGAAYETAHTAGSFIDELDYAIEPIGKATREPSAPAGDLPELITVEPLKNADQLTPAAAALWRDGTVGGDTSKALHALAVELFKLLRSPTGDLPDEITVLSHMGKNAQVMAVAQAKAEKTGRDGLNFMWRYSLKGAREKAQQGVAVAEDADFEQVPVLETALPGFKRDKSGKIEADLPNILKGIEAAHMSGWELRFDTFLNKPMIARAGSGDWRPFVDADAVAIRVSLQERSFKPIGRELMRDCLVLFAELHRFDSAIHWLNSLTWDGVPRVEQFLTRYFGVADAPYPKAVSLYWLTAQAGRVLDPGAKADMIPVLIGAQGSRKTTALQTLAVSADQYVEINLADIGKPDLARSMRGCLVGEVAELRGLQTKELESIKAWVTVTHDTWIEKFKEHPVKVARRLVLVGTTNEDEFLADATGNRRWLPVKVGTIDTVAIARDREQLWAEARDLYLTQGIIYAQAEGLAPTIHDQHRITDSWSEAIEEWLASPSGLSSDGLANGEAPFTLRDVMIGALQLSPPQMTKAVDMRVGGMLRTLGFKRGKNTINKKQVWSWSK
jgi:hypothetical protein